jgi:hypothetical protein
LLPFRPQIEVAAAGSCLRPHRSAPWPDTPSSMVSPLAYSFPNTSPRHHNENHRSLVPPLTLHHNICTDQLRVASFSPQSLPNLFTTQISRTRNPESPTRLACHRQRRPQRSRRHACPSSTAHAGVGSPIVVKRTATQVTSTSCITLGRR